MKKPSLVLREALSLAVILLLSGTVGRVAAQVGFNNTVGKIIPLPGHINELALDEARGLAYAGNFSGGRIEVISLATGQRVSSITTSPTPAATTGMALSPNKKFLVATSRPDQFGVTQTRGLTVINLNDPTQRNFYAMFDVPLAVAFSADNIAFIVTDSNFQLFNPETGEFRVVFALDGACAECVDLPVDVTQSLPREIVRASLSSSLDARWIFGQTDSFVFSYQARPPVGLLLVRPVDAPSEGGPAGALVRPPVFEQISGSADGEYFMAGHVAFNRALHVVADTPEVPEGFDNPDFIGGSGYDPDKEFNTVYFAFVNPEALGGETPDHPFTNILHVMDADNLRVRRQLRTAEQITGRIVVTANGNDLYAVSESGLLHIDLDDLKNMPLIEVREEDRFKAFDINACTTGEQLTGTIRLENPAGGPPAQFSLSTILARSGQRPALRFQPHQGVTPADVKITVDVGALGPTQGANTLPIQISTDAVNIPRPAKVVANIKAVDQRGDLYPTGGTIVEVAGDPFRDRLYALDGDNFEVLAYDTNDFRVIGRLRTGNSPTQMAVSRDGNRLFVANSQSEGLTVINLNDLRVEGVEYLPWQTIGEGHYPFSVTADNNNRMLIGVRRAQGGVSLCGGAGQVDQMHATSLAVSSPDAYGAVLNCYNAIPAVASTPDGSRVLFAEADGLTQVWDAATQRIIFSRQDFQGGLSGSLGAGPNYFIVGNAVTNESLVPRGTFPDANAAQVSSGFAVTSTGVGVRAVRPVSQVDSGSMHRINPANPGTFVAPIRMASPPTAPSSRMLELNFPFTRSLSALRDGRLVSTSSIGVVGFQKDFDAGVEIPVVSAITNAADFTTRVGTGGLISIFGRNLAAGTAGAVDTPLPTQLGDACITVNGQPLPLLYVSPEQINAQLPFSVVGPTDVLVHSSTGLSDIFVSQVDPSAPAIFKVTGPDSSQFAAIFRSENNKLATLSNPLRQNEVAIIYATGLGQVSPLALPGIAATTSPLQVVSSPPQVEFGGVAADVIYAGLAPGFVGLYQLNVRVPGVAPLGMQVPMTITTGANTTTVSVRIIE